MYHWMNQLTFEPIGTKARLRSCRVFLWNKKTTILLSSLSVLVFVHVCMNTYGHDHPNVTSPVNLLNSLRVQATDKDKGPTDNGPIDIERDGNGPKYFKILILSYMRSGSTLTGDLFQFHPNIFYIYEPLLYLWDYYVPGKEKAALRLQNRAKSFWKKRKTYIPSPADFINYMFECNLTAYNLEFLTNTAHSHHFKETGCPVLKYGMNLFNTSEQCVNNILKRCKKSRGVVLKVVRLTMTEADKILELDPDVKILHVVRDPRGILFSRMRFNNKVKGEMHKNYINICQRIWDDLKVSRRITKKHLGKIMTLRYEDLAQDLPQVTNTMHQFVGLNLAPEVKSHLEEITGSESLKGFGSKKTTRRKPYETAYRWRKKLSFSLVQQVDRACKNIYDLMGYFTFSSEAELRNLDMPAKSNHYGKGLMTLPMTMT